MAGDEGQLRPCPANRRGRVNVGVTRSAGLDLDPDLIRGEGTEWHRFDAEWRVEVRTTAAR
jgi:hypothetical protein